MNHAPNHHRAPHWGVRLGVFVLAACHWFWSQGELSSRPEALEILDFVLQALDPIHGFFVENTAATNGLLIASSLGIDALVLFLLFRSIFGPSFKPFLGLMILIGLRQCCQSMVALPPPDGLLWHDPGFPSLFVTYGVSNDLFFSGHTALAVYGAMELWRLGRLPFKVLAVALAVFEIGAVLVLHAHWTMDVYAGAVTALLVGITVQHIGPPVDRWLAKIETNG
ncbi:MAG: phosphatase PAP2-related protein [Myxococcota bacterium]